MKINSKLIDKTDFIKNTKNNSTIDTYSCDYINGLLADFVIEEGTSSNWKYRKWNSGISECWQNINGTLSVTTAWGSGLYIASIPSVSFPTNLFIERPTIQFTNIGGTSLIPMNDGGASATGTGSIQMARGTSNSSAAYILSIYAIGKWK